MMNLYIDESGSMNLTGTQHDRYFIVSIVLPKDPGLIKRKFKRFVSRNYKSLQNVDRDHKMFDVNGRFLELKGSALTPPLKEAFLKTMLCGNDLEIYYIVIDNSRVDAKFYANKARAFNYTLKLALQSFLSRNLMPKDIAHIEIDERNERTKTKFFLEEYLNTELLLNSQLLSHNVCVEYFDSCNNQLIQIADVFANIKYSDLFSGKYSTLLQNAQNSGYIKKTFVFPPKN